MLRFALVTACLSSCHLADDLDPPKCPEGSHPENDRCVQDGVRGPIVTITAPAGGIACTGDSATERAPTLAPATITVKVGMDFQFKNSDEVPYDIRGTDGSVWVTVPARGLSPFTSIAKPGSFSYHVNACTAAGTVVVEP